MFIVNRDRITLGIVTGMPFCTLLFGDFDHVKMSSRLSEWQIVWLVYLSVGSSQQLYVYCE